MFALVCSSSCLAAFSINWSQNSNRLSSLSLSHCSSGSNNCNHNSICLFVFLPWIIISKVAKEAQQQQKAPHLKTSKHSSSGRSSQENAENPKNYAARSTIELQMTMIQIKFLKNLVREEEEEEEDTYTSNNRNQIDKKRKTLFIRIISIFFFEFFITLCICCSVF